MLGLPLVARTTDDAITVIGMQPGSRLVLDGANVGRGCALVLDRNAVLSIGQRSYVTDGSLISSCSAIRIGRDCAISWGVTILDGDGHGAGVPAPVTIEDKVWVGCNVTILKGVTIGAGSIVGAGAVVTRGCPPRSLLAGNPARIVRPDVTW